MSHDQREQVRRDADSVYRTTATGEFTVVDEGADTLARHCLALLGELEQAERDKETLSEANRALQRSAIANRDGRKIAEARFASVPALVEALRRFRADHDDAWDGRSNVTCTCAACREADAALTVYETYQGKP